MTTLLSGLRLGRGAVGVWWPIRSSKPAGRGSPPLGWFDSIAAPWAGLRRVPCFLRMARKPTVGNNEGNTSDPPGARYETPVERPIVAAGRFCSAALCLGPPLFG